MVTDFLTVEPEDTLGEVAEGVQRQHTGSALVTESGNADRHPDAHGISCVRSPDASTRARRELGEWMTAEPIAAPADASLDTALRLMHAHGFHHLPVVVNERPIGVVGMRDVARRIVERQASAHVGLGFAPPSRADRARDREAPASRRDDHVEVAEELEQFQHVVHIRCPLQPHVTVSSDASADRPAATRSSSAADRGQLDAHSGVDSDTALGADDQRVEVELGDLRQILAQRREPVQRLDDGSESAAGLPR